MSDLQPLAELISSMPSPFEETPRLIMIGLTRIWTDDGSAEPMTSDSTTFWDTISESVEDSRRDEVVKQLHDVVLASMLNTYVVDYGLDATRVTVANAINHIATQL